MSLANLLHRITARRPMVLIDEEGQAYERYYMGRCFGCEFWLHHFQRPDADRFVHDHPWDAVSFILAGGYVEEVLTLESGRQIRTIQSLTAPAINLIGSARKHRIASVTPGTWTLMVVGPRHGKGWGHYPDGVTRVKAAGGTPDDWWRSSPCRAVVYAQRSAARAFDREADACAHQVEDCEN